METLGQTVLVPLLRATIALGVSAVVVAMLIRILKASSPRVQTMLWLVVLAQGLVFFQIPVELPWGDAASAGMRATAA